MRHALALLAACAALLALPGCALLTGAGEGELSPTQQYRVAAIAYEGAVAQAARMAEAGALELDEMERFERARVVARAGLDRARARALAGLPLDDAQGLLDLVDAMTAVIAPEANARNPPPPGAPGAEP